MWSALSCVGHWSTERLWLYTRAFCLPFSSTIKTRLKLKIQGSMRFDSRWLEMSHLYILRNWAIPNPETVYLHRELTSTISQRGRGCKAQRARAQRKKAFNQTENNCKPSYSLADNLNITLHLTLDIVPIRSQRSVIKLRLSTNNHPPLPSEVEIGRSSTKINLANELARGIPYVDAIATSGVHIAPGVTVDAWSPPKFISISFSNRAWISLTTEGVWLTIRCTSMDKGENLSVIEGAVFFHIEAIASRWGLACFFLGLYAGRRWVLVYTYIEAACV